MALSDLIDSIAETEYKIAKRLFGKKNESEKVYSCEPEESFPVMRRSIRNSYYDEEEIDVEDSDFNVEDD